MSGWINFDEVTVVEQNKWYYSDPVPGAFFKIELIEPAPPIKPEKIVVKRWTLDDDGDRIIYGDARALWIPPRTQALRLESGNPDIDSDSGLAFYLSRRYNAFGIYRCSVWDSPEDMKYSALVTDEMLDENGEIIITHNLKSQLISSACFFSFGDRLIRFNPDQEWSTGNDDQWGFKFKSLRPFTGAIKILMERR